MTLYTPEFNAKEFELRNYTNPYLTEAQAAEVSDTKTRVNEQLDFIAQMLGWSGANYWTNLPETVSQKRQLLSGTFGVYNSFIIPRVYEIRNWDNTFVVDRLQFIEPNRQAYVEKVLLGDDTYQIQSVKVEGDKYVFSIGTLPDSFYEQIAANVPLRVHIPTYIPAPFRRSTVGVSGDNTFVCGANGAQLILYPGYDTQQRFPYKFPIFFSGSVYYFDQPVYLSFPDSSSLGQDVIAQYDSNLERWVLPIPNNAQETESGIEGSLVWPYAGVSASLEVKIQNWVDPSDWNREGVLENFRGVWNNKGGYLPYNFVFDSLSIHGYNEKQSLHLEAINRTATFNDLVGLVYAQKTVISESPPGILEEGALWWNSDTGALSTRFLSDYGCSGWVEIDYRNEPTAPVPSSVYPNVSSFLAGSGSLAIGTTVEILDITGLSIAQNVIGVQGTLAGSGGLTLYRNDSSPYWTPVEFRYADVSDFSTDALLLPYQVPVRILDSTGLSGSGTNYKVSNLAITIAGDYEVTVTKYYTNSNWEISSNSTLQYIANSSLYGPVAQGEMRWDFANPVSSTRAASVYYGSSWVAVNSHAESGPVTTTLDLGVILFYCDGVLLSDGVPYTTDTYSFTYTSDELAGEYSFTYVPRTFSGRTRLPSVTISDALTTTYGSDISKIVFSGIQYRMSPNVYDAESPLRLWKAQVLQVAETVSHLEEYNFINSFVADLNNGPGPENWERYFIRLPLDYQRNGEVWQKTALICQDFGYWGSSIEPERMRCSPEDDLPAIYEELFLYDDAVPDYTYVYCEPYLYSNLAYLVNGNPGDYRNAGVFPATDVQFDAFVEAELIDYEPLHNRQADVTSPVAQGYGNWLGDYVNVNPCVPLTGFYTTDLLNNGIEPVAAPVWDASVYKFPPTCESDPKSYTVDANHYKVGYAYYVADASAAEDGFFDPQQESAWRNPETMGRTLYLIPGEPEQIITTRETPTLPAPVVPPTGASQPPYSPTTLAPDGAFYGGVGDYDISNLFNGIDSNNKSKTLVRNGLGRGLIFAEGHRAYAQTTLDILLAADTYSGYLVINGVETSIIVPATGGGWGGAPVLYTYNMPAPAYISSIETSVYSGVNGGAIGFYTIHADGVLLEDELPVNSTSVVTWGNPGGGGNSSGVVWGPSPVVEIFSTLNAFAALQ